MAPAHVRAQFILHCVSGLAFGWGAGVFVIYFDLISRLNSHVISNALSLVGAAVSVHVHAQLKLLRASGQALGWSAGVVVICFE